MRTFQIDNDVTIKNRRTNKYHVKDVDLEFCLKGQYKYNNLKRIIKSYDIQTNQNFSCISKDSI